jgi:hypothetical protein
MVIMNIMRIMSIVSMHLFAAAAAASCLPLKAAPSTAAFARALVTGGGRDEADLPTARERRRRGAALKEKL